MAQNRHPITLYVKRHGISLAELGRRCKPKPLSRHWVSDIASGRYPISGAAAVSLNAATEGEVTLEELLTWRQEEQRGVRRPIVA